MSTISPNMNLVLSTIGTDSGLQWEQNLNASLLSIDAHNHTSGSGVQIPASGLNINADLPFGGFSATGLESLVLDNQASVATLNAIYAISGNLYYTDGSGNVVQMTLGGAVNATSSGISSGTATASFVASVLVVNSAAATPANIQAGSILLGNNVASSNYLTLAPPNAMGSSYGLVLPALPAATKIMSLDTSGNMTAAVDADNTSLQFATNVLSIKNSGVTTAKLANSAVTLAKIDVTSAIPILKRTDYTSSGTFTVPAGVTTVVLLGVGGAGGGGGGAGDSSGSGGGGGCGYYPETAVIAVTPLDVITVTIGAGGAGGAAGTAGNDGSDGIRGDSTVFGALITFRGSPPGHGGRTAAGSGGSSTPLTNFQNAGGAGGSAANGSGGRDTSYALGGSGGNLSSGAGGGGGGAAGYGNGANGGNAGAGGGSLSAGGAASANTGAGGGGGGGATTGAGAAGGAGGSGFLRVSWSSWA